MPGQRNGRNNTDAIAAVENSYTNNVTDEFIKPVVITDEDSTANRFDQRW